MARGNPGLTGCSLDTSVKPPFRRLWAYQTPAAMLRNEPCVAAGKVFLCTYKGVIMALDADTGKPAWTRPDLVRGGTHWPTFCCGTLQSMVWPICSTSL